MYKFLLAVAVVGLTACGSAKTEETAGDSTAVVIPAETTTVVADTTTVAAPVEGEAAK